MKSYYILSLKYSKEAPMAVWWRPDGKGYTNQLDQAGIYNDEGINKLVNPAIEFGDALTIPVDDAIAMSHTAVDMAKVRDYIYHKENLAALRDALVQP